MKALLLLVILPALLSAHFVTLNWTASSTPSVTYNIYRVAGTCSAFATFTRIATAVSETTYDDSAVADGSTYCYQVTAVDADGESTPSNQASAMIPGPGPGPGAISISLIYPPRLSRLPYSDRTTTSLYFLPADSARYPERTTASFYPKKNTAAVMVTQ